MQLLHKPSDTPGPFGVVGFGAVLIEQKQPHLGGVFEFFGTHPDRDPHQIGLELLSGGGIESLSRFLCKTCGHLVDVGL